MPLKITKAYDPIVVERLSVVVYAPPGTGKTSMGFTANAPILLDFDAGAHRAANRGDAVQVSTWADVENISPEDIADYSTVVVDTAGRALDALTQDIIAKNPKMGRGGSLTLQGFGELKSRFVAWTKMIRSLGKDVVLLAHLDEQRSGDDVIERLDVQGGSKGELYKAADAMARIQMIPGQKFGVLNFNPSDVAFGKNPAQLAPLPIPDYSTAPDFLGGVIDQIKSYLNEATEAQIEEAKRVEALRNELLQLEDADAFNAKVAELADAAPKDKALLLSIAEDKGFAFDRNEKVFREAA